MVWQGIHIRDILQRVQVKPSAQFVIVHAYGGYTTNLSLDALDDDDVLLAHSANGEPLTRDHGYPMRLVVPKFYAWKSAKWISGLEFANHDRPGFWERNGYHNHGDPWAEERYS
jgi:DMSO/TMAO reductase YedYZ molybdopterin-dependent catalytic subunit